jgi:hypothetical protein
MLADMLKSYGIIEKMAIRHDVLSLSRHRFPFIITVSLSIATPSTQM